MALSPRQTLNGQRVQRISGRKIKIGTWNVRTLYEAGKLSNAIHEMQRTKIDILGISEARWLSSGQCKSDSYTFLYSGSQGNVHINGVGILLSPSISKCVKNFVAVSERIMLLRLANTPVDINIIQVYAPTADKKNDEEVERFYEQLSEVLSLTKKEEINIVMGDFNSKVGQGKINDIVGQFGLGVRNDRGDRLVQFCQEENLVILNTFFKLPPRRLYTWVSPQDNAGKIVRNQIDFLLVNKRFRNSFVSVKTYPGADIASDHNPVVGIIKLKLKATQQKNSNCQRLDMIKLRQVDVKLNVEKELSYDLAHLNGKKGTVESTWSQFKELLNKIQRTNLQADTRKRKQPWITPEILDLMDLRRINKNNSDTYRKLHRQVCSEVRKAKEAWMKSQCEELEEYERKYDSFNLHKKIKELTGAQRNPSYGILLDENNKQALDIDSKIQLWEIYIKKLFEDNRSINPGLTVGDTGPSILKDEVRKAIQQAKSGKATGPDQIHTDLLKLLDDTGIEVLTNLFNNIYESGKIPSDWLESIFIALPKKLNARKCEDHRTISLMSNVLKIFLKIIHARIYRKCEQTLADTQFGFRNGLGTRDALFAMQVLMQRSLDMNINVYACFIDFEKAFDKVQHDKLLAIMQKIGLDSRDINIISKLYWNQSAKVKVGEKLSESVSIKRGVRQGCVLSPLLFNIYSEEILNEALENLPEAGININGEWINNIRYADDTVLITDNEEDLQQLLNLVNNSCLRYGLKINVKKTKVMVFTKQPNVNCHITLNSEIVEKVRHFKYLGCLLTDEADCNQEVKIRVEQARQAFVKMKKILCDKNLSLELRLRMSRCYVLPVLLYGIEGWTLNQASCKKIEAFEMWMFRRMLRISWTEKVTNEEVLRRINTSPEVMTVIKKRKLQYFGHIMRNEKYHLLHLIIQGKLVGKRNRGRRRTSWLKNLREWYHESTSGLFRAAASKITIAMMIANLR